MKCRVQGKIVLIDDKDIEIFNKYKWHISDSGYAVWRGAVDGKNKTVRLHRLIAQPDEGLVVDHINRNKLDNRRSNLRCVTQSINAQNTDAADNAKGYYYSNSKCRKNNHWVVDYRGIDNTFATEQEAILAVEQIRKGTFVKKKDIIHKVCQKCGNDKQWYGSRWTCKQCALERCKKYYQRKKGGNNGKT